MGCCNVLINIMLGIVNSLFLLLGIALVVTTAVLRWSNIAQIAQVRNASDLNGMMDMSSLDTITIILLVLGGLVIVLSFLGLVALCCRNRCLLIVYEVVVIVLFLLHLVALIVLLVKAPSVETSFRVYLNQTVTSIGSAPSQTTSDYISKCGLMRNLSSLFTCCGANGPSDFTPTNRASCCAANTQTRGGCATPFVDTLKQYALYFLIIPSAVILFIELVVIVAVPIVIYHINRHEQFI